MLETCETLVWLGRSKASRRVGRLVQSSLSEGMADVLWPLSPGHGPAMICPWCGGIGIVLICYVQDQCYDAAACQCRAGLWWRQAGQLDAWAKTQTPKPKSVGNIENYYTDKALKELQTEIGPPMSEVFGK